MNHRNTFHNHAAICYLTLVSWIAWWLDAMTCHCSHSSQVTSSICKRNTSCVWLWLQLCFKWYAMLIWFSVVLAFADMPIYGSLPSRCITGQPRLWTMANKDLMSAKMAPAAGSLPASGSKLLQIAPRSLADLACFSHFTPRMACPVHAYRNVKNGCCLPQQVCDAILFHHVSSTIPPHHRSSSDCNRGSIQGSPL